MIFLSEHGSDRDSLSDDLRMRSDDNLFFKMSILKKKFETEAKRLSSNGAKSMEFVIAEKKTTAFMNKELADRFIEYLVGEDFEATYTYNEADKYYHFKIKW